MRSGNYESVGSLTRLNEEEVLTDHGEGYYKEKEPLSYLEKNEKHEPHCTQVSLQGFYYLNCLRGYLMGYCYHNL